MDPTSIPLLPIVTSVVATVDERNNNVAVAHGTPNHPTYKEMIHNAIAALKKRNGSSKRAIAKYIDQTFTHLPSTHSALLTLHLKRLKSEGVLVMVKKSYKFARSYSSSHPTQPKCGRPRKPKPNPEQPQPLKARNNVKRMLVALGLEDESANSGVKKRGPGRPPKESPVEVSEPKIRRLIQVKIGLERRPKLKSVSKIPNGPKRGVGRPPKTQSNVSVIPFMPSVTVRQSLPVMPIASPRGRGRPKKINAGAMSHSGAAPQAVRGGHGRGRGGRRGRGILSGRSVGRPKKNHITSHCEKGTSDNSDNLRRKLRNFQSKVRESLVPIKGIIQELETLASMDLN